MEDHEQPQQDTGSRPSRTTAGAEPVRSRWTPKPEQILILESIFNSGMVNPPKDETVRIRKLLEKFGSVGDANVFYWFQNRRSRSRRRQRQIQAGLAGARGDQPPQAQPQSGIQYENFAAGGGLAPNNYSVSNYYPLMNNAAAGSSSSSSSSSYGNNGCCYNNMNSDDPFSYSGHSAGMVQQQEYEQNPVYCSPDASSLQYPSDVITVFINGVATEVGRAAPVDMKAMFGGDFVLFDSSGAPVEVNEYGFLVHSLQHGESYFLVPRHS